MKNIYILIILLFFTANIQAQAFSLDTSFNINYDFYFPGSSASVYGLNYEPDGKLMIYGFFHDDYSNPADILRIYEDGSLDNTWQYPWADGVDFIERLDNGYILRSVCCLDKFPYNGHLFDTIWRKNFNRDDPCGWAYHPYIFSDGSMFVGGDTCNLSNNKIRFFRRFFANGSMDTNFLHNTNRPVFGITKYSSDKLLIYGGGVNGFTIYDTTQINRM
ncbi:MAG: hypothetical protein GY756_23890, partial [bacterium]|nr:hypothetical protein [bacterium]